MVGDAHPPDTTRYGDIVNEQAGRIILECILVLLIFRYLFVKSNQPDLGDFTCNNELDALKNYHKN